MKKLFTLSIFTFLLFNGYSQNVGIGTNAPNASAQLDVTSTSKGLLIPRMTTVQRSVIANPAIGLMVYDTNLKAFYFYNGSSWNTFSNGGGGASTWALSGNNIYNSNTGNVGIGSGSGIREKLSVKGNVFITYTNGNDLVNGGNRAAVNLHGSSTGGGRINFLNTDTTIGAHISYYRLNGQLNEFSFNHGSNSRQLSLQENGNVGIGKIATEKLDVNGNMRSRRHLIIDSNIAVAGNVLADGKITGAGLFSSTGLSVSQGSIFAGTVFGNSTATFSGLVSSNTGMAINDAEGTFTFKNGTEEKGFAQISGDDFRVGTFSSNTEGKFHIRTGGNNNLTVTSGGNVGIGTLNPSAKLHVIGRSYFRGNGEVLAIDGTSNPNIAFYNSGVYKSFISQSSTELYIGVNNARLHLDASQIAIGGVIAAASGYKLTVTGKVICEELKVQLQGAWPDYVFQNKYNLMPMSELRNFINTNNHLPNIPAAADMEKNGIAVGEMQRKMMEKIEELTLYVLQLEEKVNNLSKK